MEEISLDTILIIPFLRAIQNKSPKTLHPELTNSKFETLISEFLSGDVAPRSPIEQRIMKRKAKMKLVAYALYIIERNPKDEEIMEVLRSQGIDITFETHFEGRKIAADKLKHWDFVNRQEKAKTKDGATQDKKKKKAIEKNSIFDMLTSLSTGLELALDFNTMVVNEYISYRKKLRLKQERLEKHNKK